MIESLDIDIRRKRHTNGLTTIEDLSFSVDHGQFVAIVGPSGAGKTSLLRILAGLDQAWDGKVLVNPGAIPLWQASPHIGYVFQEPRLMPWLTVRHNIAMVTAHDASTEQDVDGMLERVGLSAFADAYPGQLSGGMQRRVALARAFIVQPSLLLLDEAFQSLDDPTAESLRSLLLDLWREHRPMVFFVTHHLREALALADRVLFVSQRPARLVLDHGIHIPRPRDPEGEAVNALIGDLLKQHPRLLSGEAAGNTPTDG